MKTAYFRVQGFHRRLNGHAGPSVPVRKPNSNHP